MKSMFRKLKEKFTDELFLIELLFFAGLILIVFTNFKINLYFGMYFLGVALIVLSIFLFMFRKR